MPTVLIVGATRGLGAHLAAQYNVRPGTTVLATTRGTSAPPASSFPNASFAPASSASSSSPQITWIPQIDICQPNTASQLTSSIHTLSKVKTIDTLVINAGYFGKETFPEPHWNAQIRMYITSAIGPVFVVTSLFKEGLLGKGSKVILVTSEAGSLGLRHEKEGGGMYGHHGSKAAENMVGRLLSLDLKSAGVAVGMVHPGFMRTEMTRSVGFDEFWDVGGAVTPDVAAASLIKWVENEFSIEKTGEYWAPRGPRDIGTAKETMGYNLSTPLKLPW